MEMTWRFSSTAVIQTVTAVFIAQSIDMIFNWWCRWTTLNKQSNVMIARNTILPVPFTVNMNRLKLQGSYLKIQYSLFRLYCIWNGRLITSKKSATIMMNRYMVLGLQLFLWKLKRCLKKFYCQAQGQELSKMYNVHLSF